jgi:hypothetical protein
MGLLWFLHIRFAGIALVFGLVFFFGLIVGAVNSADIVSCRGVHPLPQNPVMLPPPVPR